MYITTLLEIKEQSLDMIKAVVLQFSSTFTMCELYW